MREIFTQLLRSMADEKDTVLVTIVERFGSTPRSTGAMMLVGRDGLLCGSIGGGEVEAASIDMALGLLESRSSRLHSFRLRNDDRADSLHMVCGGDVDVWFSYIPHGDPVWRALAEQTVWCFETSVKGVFIQDLTGQRPLLVREDGVPLAGEAAAKLPELSGLREMRLGNQFLLPLAISERVVVFGGGHISRVLVPLLKSVNFSPVVFDCRREFADPGAFPAATAVICGDYSQIAASLSLRPEDYIVVVTNGHVHDFEVLEQVLRDSAAYVGAIGSRAKTASVNRRLAEAGIPQDIIAGVHAPIGTPIKAATPEEIAVSITGELIYVRALRREKNGPAKNACPMHE